MDGDDRMAAADPPPRDAQTAAPSMQPFFMHSDAQARASMDNIARMLVHFANRAPPSMLPLHPDRGRAIRINRAFLTTLRRLRAQDPDAGDDHNDAYGDGGFGAVPASGVAMACLPERTVGEGDEVMVKKAECAVCLEAYEAGETLRTMPCSHGFHEGCIFGWLRVSRLCPLCRFAMPAESETEEEDGEDGLGTELASLVYKSARRPGPFISSLRAAAFSLKKKRNQMNGDDETYSLMEAVLPQTSSSTSMQPFFMHSDATEELMNEVFPALWRRLSRLARPMLHGGDHMWSAWTPPRRAHVDGDDGIGIGVDDGGAYGNGGFGAVPASGEAIVGLPERTVGEGEAAEEAECAVCFEGYEAGDALRTMPCSHGFHEGCIFGWLRVSRLCPLCRFAMPAESETEEEDSEDE
ncbi:hypothetical protein EJB05_29625, partial [Eragrostis curvula]